MIEKHPISWLLERVDGLDLLFAPGTIYDQIFDAGCYIAGGFPRKLLRDGTTANMSLLFARNIGDIDVFCPDEAAYKAAKSGLNVTHWEITLGKNAIQTEIRMSPKKFNDVDCRLALPCSSRVGYFSTKLQVINCRFDPPKEMLESFDFINCRIAFDRDHVWLDPEIVELEASKTLKIGNVADLVGPRVVKYFRLHDYEHMDQQSREKLVGWLAPRISPKMRKGWGTCREGRVVVPKLARLGPEVLPDRVVAGLVGEFRRNERVLGYSSLVDGHPVNKEIDPMESELNRRKMDLQPGDLVSVDFETPAVSKWAAGHQYKYKGYENWKHVLLLSPIVGDIAHPGGWHVLTPDTTLAVVYDCAFTGVVSKFDECDDVAS